MIQNDRNPDKQAPVTLRGAETLAILPISPVEKNSMSGKRVLIVDDDETFRLIAREALTSRGMLVTEAANGVQAREKVQEGPLDLILVDIMMPGLDGVALCRELRSLESTKTTPILVVTALNDPKVLQDAQRFGANDYLLKPVDAQVLRGKVEKMLTAGSRP
jgi:CheY-like chemotaxis protein